MHATPHMPPSSPRPPQAHQILHTPQYACSVPLVRLKLPGHAAAKPCVPSWASARAGHAWPWERSAHVRHPASLYRPSSPAPEEWWPAAKGPRPSAAYRHVRRRGRGGPRRGRPRIGQRLCIAPWRGTEPAWCTNTLEARSISMTVDRHRDRLLLSGKNSWHMSAVLEQ